MHSIYECFFNNSEKITKEDEIFLKYLDIKFEGYKALPNDKNIYLNELPNEIINLFSKIPKINKIYKCKKCEKIPFISMEVQINGEIIYQINCPCFNNDNKYIFSYDFPIKINNYLVLTDIKDNKKESSLPFKRREDFFNFFKLIELYNNIKAKISERNFGNTKSNLAFVLYENLLSIALYHSDENIYAIQNLEIYKNINFKYFEIYNEIQELSNGKKFHFKIQKTIPINFKELEYYIEIDKLIFCKLCENLYFFKDSFSHTMLIKGALDSLENDNKNLKIYNLYDNKLFFDEQKIEGEIISILHQIIYNKDLILIDTDLLLGFANMEKLYLIVYNLNTNFNFMTSILLSDKIIKIISLKNNFINKYSKNKNAFQFLLLGNNYIYLYEYIKNKLRYNLLKSIKYSNKDKEINSFNKPCHLIYNGILIFSKDIFIYFFDLKNFQLNTIIDINLTCKSLLLICESQLLCLRGDDFDSNLIINLKNKKSKDFDFPYILNEFNNILLDNRYLFFNAFIFDLKNKKYQLFLSNDYFENIKKDALCLKYSFININDKEFAKFYIYGNDLKNLKALIDIYSFID